MKIAHIAIWTNDLDRLREFYKKYFNGKSNEKYINESKGFSSYFITFEGSVSLELMQRKDITQIKGDTEIIGFAHLAFSVGSKQNVDEMTKIIRQAGYAVLGEPRFTGDGYYESVITDPDGNRIEIVA